ncbi:MAG: AtpZ/AtpI family protein [Cyclobacteriaceae bacterium]|nr:AtpZ/AtpI family protein [Cyclobacteriaceae bacterium]
MDKTKSPKANRQPERKSQISDYVKYSGLAFQMAALIFLGYWVGGKIDDWLEFQIPVFTIILIVAFIILTLYSLIRSLPKQ